MKIFKYISIVMITVFALGCNIKSDNKEQLHVLAEQKGNGYMIYDLNGNVYYVVDTYYSTKIEGAEYVKDKRLDVPSFACYFTEQGTIEEQLSIDSNGFAKVLWSAIYDKYGNYTALAKKVGDNIAENRILDLDSNNYISKMGYFENDILLHYIHIDVKNHLLNKQHFLSVTGDTLRTYIYLRDSNNYMVEKVLVNYAVPDSADRQTSEMCKYIEFDEKGNWTKRIMFNSTSANIRNLVEREIYYY